MIWQCGPYFLDLSYRPLLMGILNVTPDSFSDGYPDLEKALAQAEKMVNDGADIIDVGGESTRPGSDPVDVSLELARVLPVIEALAERYELPISIDTRRPQVARKAIAAGAGIVNHVSASLDCEPMIEVLKQTDAGYVAMHMRAQPKTMQRRVAYDNVVMEVTRQLAAVRRLCLQAGIPEQRLLFDPGIGFGKKLTHNLALINGFRQISNDLGRPLLVGISRKSWLTKFFRDPLEDFTERDAYTVVASLAIPFPEVAVHRVHNVKMLKNAFALHAELSRQDSP